MDKPIDQIAEELAQAALRGFFGEGFNNMSQNAARKTATEMTLQKLKEFLDDNRCPFGYRASAY